MISLYSKQDPTLFTDSCHTIYSATILPENIGLHVVPVKNIISVVSMQPHDYQVVPGESRYFVWEYIGLQVAVLDGTEESMAE